MSHVMSQDISDVCPPIAHNCKVRNGFRGDLRAPRSLIFHRNRAKSVPDDAPNRLQIPPSLESPCSGGKGLLWASFARPVSPPSAVNPDGPPTGETILKRSSTRGPVAITGARTTGPGYWLQHLADRARRPPHADSPRPGRTLREVHRRERARRTADLHGTAGRCVSRRSMTRPTGQSS
jgi:hypothetical protein